MQLVPIQCEEGHELLFSDQSADTDVVAALMLIQGTYFGKHRQTPEFLKQIRHSLSFNLYLRNRSDKGMVRQVGFARVVTDYVSFGWICDFVIEGKYRRRGFGSKLMECILGHPDLQSATLNLGTKDAHAFYAQFGFEKCEQMMRRPS